MKYVQNEELNKIIERRMPISQESDAFYEKYNKLDNDIEDRLDKNADEIFKYIQTNLNDLTFEDVLEAYSHTGSAPNLLYDDNGNWAIDTEGYQNIRIQDDEDLTTQFLVKAKKFKPTIREALQYFVEHYLDEDEN